MATLPYDGSPSGDGRHFHPKSLAELRRPVPTTSRAPALLNCPLRRLRKHISKHYPHRHRIPPSCPRHFAGALFFAHRQRLPRNVRTAATPTYPLAPPDSAIPRHAGLNTPKVLAEHQGGIFEQCGLLSYDERAFSVVEAIAKSQCVRLLKLQARCGPRGNLSGSRFLGVVPCGRSGR